MARCGDPGPFYGTCREFFPIRGRSRPCSWMMGDLPLTALGKLNQVSPFFRHGVVSSVFPCPTALPHGLTIDIMQQGGSSGSPILRVSDGKVVGMMSSGVVEWRLAQSQHASLGYSLNTNISIAEPAHVIHEALVKFRKHQPINFSRLPTLAEQRAICRPQLHN